MGRLANLPADPGRPGADLGEPLAPAVAAFDRIAEQFDQRFGPWRSVAAQRRSVRRALAAAFSPGASVLELGGGTGDDALFLAERGVRVLLTDAAPRMVARAAAKVEQRGLEHLIEVRPLAIEALPQFAAEWSRQRRAPFDGAYSNFAALNCVAELAGLAEPLARLLRPGAALLLVIFGVWPLGEMVWHALAGDWPTVFRRRRRGPVPARVGGTEFPVYYHRPGAVARALAPFFRLEAVRGVGVLVPPSAAEPRISAWPRLVALLEAADRVAGRLLARCGDHLLLQFRRSWEPAP